MIFVCICVQNVKQIILSCPVISMHFLNNEHWTFRIKINSHGKHLTLEYWANILFDWYKLTCLLSSLRPLILQCCVVISYHSYHRIYICWTLTNCLIFLLTFFLYCDTVKICYQINYWLIAVSRYST